MTVDITYCKEVEPSVYEREVEISVFDRVFCIAKSLVVSSLDPEEELQAHWIEFYTQLLLCGVFFT